MVAPPTHTWHVSLSEARELQRKLAHQILIRDLPSRVNQVAGFDVSYLKEENILIAGMVLLAYPSLVLKEKFVITDTIHFPYIPGYLSFREAPGLLRLIKAHAGAADIYIFDGHGIAHPRGLGIASHIGVLMQKPSIGCAKKKLIGHYDPPGIKKGACSDLIHKETVCGTVLRTKDNTKPVFISVGHLVNLHQSVQFILTCTSRYRLPEPTRLAHLAVTEQRLKLTGTSFSSRQEILS